MSDPSMRSPLSRVRGLGSAKDGTSHFIRQRVTAIALIPLCLWFISSLLRSAAFSGREGLLAWISHGSTAVLLILTLIALFTHAMLGVQVIIEDYVHKPCCKTAGLLLNFFIMFGLAAASIFAVLKLHFHLVA